MNNKSIAITVAQEVTKFFSTITPSEKWDHMSYDYYFKDKKHLGYVATIRGETCDGCTNYYSVHIRSEGDVDNTDNVVKVQYTNVADWYDLAFYVQKALDDLDYLIDNVLGSKPKKKKSKAKYRKGGHILTLDELANQEFVYWYDKITHNGWFMSWQFRLAARNIGENGCIFYAIKEEDDA